MFSGQHPGTAQMNDEPITSSAEERRIRLLEIPDAVERAFFEHDPDYYDNQDWDRQLGSFFMINYPENEIERDGSLLNLVTQDLLRQQSLDSPPIRTQDLVNPFNSSLQSMPRAGSNPPIRGSEFMIPAN